MAWFFQRRRPVETELDSELRFHIDKLVEEKTAAGLTPEQARREAMLEFGGREQLKEELRDVHRMATLENTVSNIKSGIRLIRSSVPVISARRDQYGSQMRRHARSENGRKWISTKEDYRSSWARHAADWSAAERHGSSDPHREGSGETRANVFSTTRQRVTDFSI